MKCCRGNCSNPPTAPAFPPSSPYCSGNHTMNHSWEALRAGKGVCQPTGNRRQHLGDLEAVFSCATRCARYLLVLRFIVTCPHRQMSESEKCQEDETLKGQAACLSTRPKWGGFESGLPAIPTQGWARGDIFPPSPALFLLSSPQSPAPHLLICRAL